MPSITGVGSAQISLNVYRPLLGGGHRGVWPLTSGMLDILKTCVGLPVDMGPTLPPFRFEAGVRWKSVFSACTCLEVTCLWLQLHVSACHI